MDGRLTIKFREVSKSRDSGLNLSNRSEIWQAPRQQGCWDACQISERYDNDNIRSSGLETSRDPAVRRPSTLWTDALSTIVDITGDHDGMLITAIFSNLLDIRQTFFYTPYRLNNLQFIDRSNMNHIMNGIFHCHLVIYVDNK